MATLKDLLERLKGRPGFQVKGSGTATLGEDYSRHYSRRIESDQIRDFSSKKSSRRIYFGEFVKWLEREGMNWTIGERELMAHLRGSGKLRIDEAVLEHYKEQKWGKRIEQSILKDPGIRLRFIRWYQQRGAALACTSTPETHLLALQHGSELLEAAKRLELVQSIAALPL